jgi:hypothetical protein
MAAISCSQNIQSKIIHQFALHFTTLPNYISLYAYNWTCLQRLHLTIPKLYTDTPISLYPIFTSIVWIPYDPHFLTSALSADEWSASPPRERTPGTHWIRGWVDPRAGLHDLQTRKFLTLLGLELLSHPAHSQSLYRLHYPGSHLSTTCFFSDTPIYIQPISHYDSLLTSTLFSHAYTIHITEIFQPIMNNRIRVIMVRSATHTSVQGCIVVGMLSGEEMSCSLKN